MERNIILDCFKLFFSFLVITIHLPGFFAELPLFGWSISNGIAKIAVPCFFIVNGYFVASIIEDGRSVKKYLLKLLVLYIVWLTIYTPFYNGYEEGRALAPPSLLFLLFRFFIPWWHLWYIIALLGGVLLLFVLKRFKIIDRVLLVFALFFYFYGSALQYANLFHIDIPCIFSLTNNFLHFGFPFIFLGYYIRKKRFIEKKFKNKTITLLLLFIVLLMESYVAYLTGTKVGMYFTLPFLCPMVFIAIMQIKVPESTGADNYISKLSGSVYFSHLLVIFFTKRTFPDVSETVLFFPILFISLLLSVAVIELNRQIRIFL